MWERTPNPQGETVNSGATTNTKNNMKVKITKIPEGCTSAKVGDMVTIVKAAELDTLTANGLSYETEAETRLIKAREVAVDNAIKASKAFAPKEDTSEVRANAIAMEATKDGLGVSYISNLPPIKAAGLSNRVTASDAGEGLPRIDMGEVGLRETVRGFLQASEDDHKLLKNGGIVRACNKNEGKLEEIVTKARVKSTLMADIISAVQKGANFKLTEDFVKAAYDGYADPAGALGGLNTAITLQMNLGHLENQLIMIDDITTDVTGTPVLFNQWARSRYIKVPGVMLKTATNSWATNALPGNDVDVMVQMANYAGVNIGVNNLLLGSTARQLLNEQKNPQLYGLAEYILYTVIAGAINGTTRFDNTGVTQTTVTAASGFVDPTFGKGYFNVGGNPTLSTFVSALRWAQNLSKFPGGDEPPTASELMRYAWVHSNLEAAISADTNFQLNTSIQGIAQNKGENLITTGMFTRIGNNKFRASQLVVDNNTLSGTGADSGTNAATVVPGSTTTAKVVGIAGTRSGLMFVSRAPLDYTKVMPDVPQTAAIEMVTSPKLGIPFMVVKSLDHNVEVASMRVQTQWGIGIGDERQLMLLRQQ